MPYEPKIDADNSSEVSQIFYSPRIPAGVVTLKEMSGNPEASLVEYYNTSNAVLIATTADLV